MLWYESSQHAPPQYVAGRMSQLGTRDRLLAAAETSYNNGDCWIKGWLAFTDRRIFWFQRVIGLIPSEGMEEFSYADDLSLGNRPLSGDQWFCLAGVSFKLPKAEAQSLYQFVDQVVQAEIEYRSQQSQPVVVQQTSAADEIMKLASLRDAGVLTEAEFSAQKAALLGGGSQGAASSPAAWHPDPHGRHELRYWDGAAWTSHVSDSGIVGTDPA